MDKRKMLVGMMGGSKSVEFLVRDEFTTSLAAGSVNTSLAEPIGGTRVVSDAPGTLSIADGKVFINDGTASHILTYSGVAIEEGLVIAATIHITEGLTFGISSASDGSALTKRIYMGAGMDSPRDVAPSYAYMDAKDIQIFIGVYRLILVVRTIGFFYFIQGLNYPDPTLIFIDRRDTTDPFYPAFNNYVTSKKLIDNFVVSKYFTPTKLTSSLSFINGIVTEDCGKADNIVVAKIKRAAGSVGIITHYIDADNYIRVIYDGTNSKIIQRLAGVESDLASSAKLYEENDIMVETKGSSIRAWYRYSEAGASATMNAALVSATKVGTFNDSDDAGNTVTGFECYARGSEAEYKGLVTHFKKSNDLLVYVGDSLTSGNGVTAPYPKQLSEAYTTPKWYDQLAVGGDALVNRMTDGAKLDGYTNYWNNLVLVFWLGTNDINYGATPASVYANVVSYCTARKAAGYKVIVLTMLPRIINDEPDILTFNASIVTNYASFADALVDVAANELLDDCNDLTYYSADKTHLTNTGYTVVAGLVKPAVDGLLS